MALRAGVGGAGVLLGGPEGEWAVLDAFFEDAEGGVGGVGAGEESVGGVCYRRVWKRGGHCGSCGRWRHGGDEKGVDAQRLGAELAGLSKTAS